MESAYRSIMKERVKKIVTTTSLKAQATTINQWIKHNKSIFKNYNAQYQRQASVVSRLESRLKTSTERKDS